MNQHAAAQQDWHTAFEQAIKAAEAAGVAILPHFRTNLEVTRKEDRSPVTQADMAAHHALAKALAGEWPLISEEDDANKHGTLPTRYWLVDPLDGTKSFLRGEDSFCVCVALMEHGEPVLGVLHAPVTGVSYGGGKGLGAWKWRKGEATRQPIQTRAVAAEGMDALISHSHHDPKTEAWLAEHTIRSRKAMPSAIKFGLVAEGVFDCYPRFGPTMEWDTAAGQAIIEAAGGRVIGADGQRFRYGKAGFRNGAFVVWGR